MPPKLVRRCQLISRLIGMWASGGPVSDNPVYQDLGGSIDAPVIVLFGQLGGVGLFQIICVVDDYSNESQQAASLLPDWAILYELAAIESCSPSSSNLCALDSAFGTSMPVQLSQLS